MKINGKEGSVLRLEIIQCCNGVIEPADFQHLHLMTNIIYNSHQRNIFNLDEEKLLDSKSAELMNELIEMI